jgi:hypothetical protein
LHVKVNGRACKLQTLLGVLAAFACSRHVETSLGTVRSAAAQAGGGAGSLVSRKGPIARYEHSGAQSSTSASSGSSVPNALVRTKSRQPSGVAEAEFWRLVGPG